MKIGKYTLCDKWGWPHPRIISSKTHRVKFGLTYVRLAVQIVKGNIRLVANWQQSK